MALFGFLYVVSCLLSSSLAIKVISHEGACKATTDQGNIDLSPLASKDSTPKFQAIEDPEDPLKMYEFNPCYDFNDGNVMSDNSCKNVSVCEIMPYGKTTYEGMGSAGSVTWQVSSNGNVTLFYRPKDVYPSAKVVLVCSKTSGDTITAEHDPADPDYPYITLVLKSKHCCAERQPEPTKSPSSSTGGLSIGTILFIILLVVICLYIAGGLAYTVGYKKSAGKNRIPNVELWTQLPGLVVDGAKFTFCCESGQVKRGGTYDQI